MQLKEYERLKLSVNLLTQDDVLARSGEGRIADGYDDGWVNPFSTTEVYNG